VLGPWKEGNASVSFSESAINLLRVGDLQSQSHNSKESKASFACPLINTDRIDVTGEISEIIIIIIMCRLGHGRFR